MTTAKAIFHSPRGAPVSSWVASGLCAVVLATGAIVISHSVIRGPQLRAAEQARTARTIAEEDRTACAKLGADKGAGRFADCAAVLSDVRAHHIRRVTEQSYAPFSF